MNQKKLRSTGIATGMRHAQYAKFVVLVISVEFTIDGIARASRPDALGAPALRDESRDDPVKFELVVESFLRELNEVSDGFRCVFLE